MLPTIRKHRTQESMLNNLFNDDFFPSFFNWETTTNSNTPAVNVEETEKAFMVDVAAPGLDKKDFKVSIDGNLLTISSERKSTAEDKKHGVLRQEFSYNSFSRSFTLPENTEINKISATHKNGVLTIEIPKAEVEVKKALEVKIK